jgi:ABC-type multidrug transport system ATPase subunit
MIRVESLSKRYGPVAAVDHLSFEVEPGETFALIGPNGAGKTTTLRLLLGLSRPDAGTIEIGANRRPPHDPETRRAMGYVPQKVEFSPGRSVAEVLRFFAELRGLPRSAVDRVLERVGLTAHAARRATELSGGYTQRLSLGQALLADPALLVLDEPTASLDPEATWEFRSLVEQLQREGKTILFCSHLLTEVERVADRVLILVQGRRAALERLDDLRARQASATRLEVELGSDPSAALAVLAGRGVTVESLPGSRVAFEAVNGRALDTLGWLREAGVDVHSFELQRPSLEEIFLSVVRGGKRDA